MTEEKRIKAMKELQIHPDQISRLPYRKEVKRLSPNERLIRGTVGEFHLGMRTSVETTFWSFQVPDLFFTDAR